MSNLNEATINYYTKNYANNVLTEQQVEELVEKIHQTFVNKEKHKLKKMSFFTSFDNMEVLFKERVDFYNYVVNNVAQKFHNHFSHFSVHDLLIPKDAKFIGFSRYDETKYDYSINVTDSFRNGNIQLTKDDFVLFNMPDVKNHMRAGKVSFVSPTTKLFKIQLVYLMNDPIVIAQYVRKTIMERIEESYASKLEDASKELEEVKSLIEEKTLDYERALQLNEAREQQKQRILRIRGGKKIQQG